MKYVLDTNVVARLLDNDARVAPRFAAVAADSFGMPLVVLAVAMRRPSIYTPVNPDGTGKAI